MYSSESTQFDINDTVVIDQDTYASTVDVDLHNVIIRDNAKFYIDEPIRVWKLSIGEDGTPGHLIFQQIEGITRGNPSVLFYDTYGEDDSKLVLHRGSIQIEETFGSMSESGRRYIMRGDIRFRVTTTSGFKPKLFSLEDMEHIEIFDLHPLMSFIDEDNNYRDLYLGAISSYTPSISISISSYKIEGGRATWNKFKHSEGKEFTITGKIPRLQDDVFIERLEHIAEVNQRYSPILLVTENYTGYCLITGIDQSVTAPTVADYSISCKRVREAYE